MSIGERSDGFERKLGVGGISNGSGKEVRPAATAGAAESTAPAVAQEVLR